ncbi:hypothetical protein SF2A_24980 (plasmid) [Shigella flexneri G1663]|nr:hypothetical protein SF2A_24980 [Shigella flexneri G1663]
MGFCAHDGMPAINAKRVYQIMRQNALLLGVTQELH